MWDDWGPCSTTCGNGSQQRTRNCTDPSPQHGGADCDENSSTDQQTCYIDDCPIDGAWSTWDDWGPCSTTCGNGTQQRTRNCSDPSPQHGGADCDIITATATANQTCNTGDCPAF
ncbi:thrombospondin-1-like [Argopecten irradians]|uniref:thrombospondin-1-like n=1 Tax=Argopecten irradians TaxID=31199 RepID=UPI0037172A1C